MNPLARLYKVAYTLDRKGMYNEAQEIERVMESLAKRVGLQLEDMVALADHFDQTGDAALADKFDEMVKVAKAKHQAPKKWWDKMVKEVSEGNEDYSEERVNETVGEIWYNKLSDEKRSEIYKRHGETKSPNK